MSDSFKPGDRAYSIHPPSSGSDDAAVIQACVNVVGTLFDAVATTKREGHRRAIVEVETKARIEEFRTNMTLLEKQLESDHHTELERQRSWFAIAAQLVEQGKDQAAVAVLEIFSKEGRKSIVQELIDYHGKLALASSNRESGRQS